jgi:predicted kinase
MMQHLILIRGLPGSGKSTFAAIISEEHKYPIIAVDDFFTDEQGNYRFNHLLNHEAYRRCEQRTRDALQAGAQKVIVHHTFTMDWEMEPYFKLAKQFDSLLHVLTMEKYHAHENIHEISEAQIQKMAAKYKVKLY